MTTALNDVQRELASAIAQGVVTGMKPPAEASTSKSKATLEEIVRQSKPGSRIKFEDLDIQLPEKDDPADKPSKAPAKATVDEDDSSTVELGQQLLGIIEKPLNSFKVPFVGSKLGSIAVGGGLGFLYAEVNRGYADSFPEPAPGAGISRKQRRIAANVGGLVLVGLVGKKLMSNEANFAAATVLGVNVIADVLPINEWVTTIVNRLRGVSVQQRVGNRTSPGYVMNQPMPIRHGVGADAISRGGR